MDNNPYNSPQATGGFLENLDPAFAHFELDKRLLERAAYRTAELKGWGGHLAIFVFFGVLYGTLLFSYDQNGNERAHVVLALVLSIVCTVMTHVLVNRMLAQKRIDKMKSEYDITPGDPVTLEVLTGCIRFESDRVRLEWPMNRVQSIGMPKDLTLVVDEVVTIPIPRDADCGEWDFASFIALCEEQQRRYRKTEPFVDRLRAVFRRGG